MSKNKIAVCSASILLLSLSFLSGCKDGQQRDSGYPSGGGGGGGHSHYSEGKGAGNN